MTGPFASLRQAVWPPLPVWRRLDTAVAAVTAYTAAVVVVLRATGVDVPGVGGASAALNALILGLLLSFRNAQSYDRWWEGRKLWGQLVNDSRNLCLKARALPGGSADARARLRVLVPGFAVALKNHLRGGKPLQAVPGFEADPASPRHVPLYVAGRVFDVLQAERAAGRMSDVDLLRIDPHVRALMDVSGACERIRSSPLPQSYRSLLRHGLTLYLLSTPWLVAEQLLWWSIPSMALLTYFLLGVELTAESVEEPFGKDGDDLTLSTLCDKIRQSVDEVLGD